MSLLSKITNGIKNLGDAIVDTKVGSVVADVLKTGLEIPNEAYKSFKGEDLVKLKYDTKVGQTVGNINYLGISSGQKALMGFANGITGGYAGKLNQALVKGYEGYEVEKRFDGPLGKIETGIQTISPILGTAAASIASAGKEKQGAPSKGGAPTGMVTTVAQQSKPVSILSDANAFLQTDIGKSLQGALGGFVQNIVSPKNQAQQNAVAQKAQAAVINQSEPPAAQQRNMTAVQASLFGSPNGYSVNLPGGVKVSGPSQQPEQSGFMKWFSSLPVWAIMGIFLVITGVIAALLSLVFRRRRR